MNYELDGGMWALQCVFNPAKYVSLASTVVGIYLDSPKLVVISLGVAVGSSILTEVANGVRNGIVRKSVIDLESKVDRVED